MSRICCLLGLAGTLLLVGLPNTASAAPYLEWEGASELNSGSFKLLAPAAITHGSDGDRTARNVARGITGGVALGIGIPLTVTGALMAGVAVNFFVTADAAMILGDDLSAGAARIGGVIFLVIALGLLSPGISLIISGVKSLSKISRLADEPDPRLAKNETRRARWGMTFSAAPVAFEAR